MRNNPAGESETRTESGTFDRVSPHKKMCICGQAVRLQKIAPFGWGGACPTELSSISAGQVE